MYLLIFCLSKVKVSSTGGFFFRHLAELDDAKTAFFSNASHELRERIFTSELNVRLSVF